MLDCEKVSVLDASELRLALERRVVVTLCVVADGAALARSVLVSQLYIDPAEGRSSPRMPQLDITLTK